MLFKGDRKYITGADLFNEIISFYSEDEISSMSLSYHGFIVSDKVEVIHRDSGESSENKKNDVTCKIKILGKSDIDITVNAVGGAAINSKSVPFHEETIINNCTIINDEISCLEMKEFSFIELTVAMNKYLLMNLFADAEGKWVFTRIDFFRFSDSAEELKLKFKHNFNFRLLKTEVWSSGAYVADIYYTLLKS